MCANSFQKHCIIIVFSVFMKVYYAHYPIRPKCKDGMSNGHFLHFLEQTEMGNNWQAVFELPEERGLRGFDPNCFLTPQNTVKLCTAVLAIYCIDTIYITILFDL